MKTRNKKMIFIFITIIIICIIVFIILGEKEKSNVNSFEIGEYTPQEEISTEQLRQTLVTLYFQNKETKELVPEARMLDSKKLLDNPYNELIQLLINGPKNENLQKLIPENTVINNIKFEKGVVYIDFSKEFIKTENVGAEEEQKLIDSIVNTLTELTEVDGVKILISGSDDIGFESGQIKFKDVFKRNV